MICNFITLQGKSADRPDLSFSEADLFSLIEGNPPFETLQDMDSKFDLYSNCAMQFRQNIESNLEPFQRNLLDQVFQKEFLCVYSAMFSSSNLW